MPILPSCPQVMKVKLQPPSGTELPAFNPIVHPSAITQVLLLANPQKVRGPAVTGHRWGGGEGSLFSTSDPSAFTISAPGEGSSPLQAPLHHGRPDLQRDGGCGPVPPT